MRRGEWLGLRWGDVDLASGPLSVGRALVSVGYELHETRGKTRTARRCIDLEERTIELLELWRHRRQGEDPGFDPSNDDAYVFARPDGSPLTPRCCPTCSTARGALGATAHPTARPAPHACHVPLEVRRAHQGRQRTARTLHARLHDGHLPTRTSWHASRVRPCLRSAARSSTGFYPGKSR